MLNRYLFSVVGIFKKENSCLSKGQVFNFIFSLCHRKYEKYMTYDLVIFYVCVILWRTNTRGMANFLHSFYSMYLKVKGFLKEMLEQGKQRWNKMKSQIFSEWGKKYERGGGLDV